MGVDTGKFPDGIKAVADHVHADGLKFGLYVTPGIAENAVRNNSAITGTGYHAKDIAVTSTKEKNHSCKPMYGHRLRQAGAQEFVNSWAKQFADWGVDYLKIDGVGRPDVKAWSLALRSSGRPIHFALSTNLSISDASTWRQYANGWRTQGDVECYCGASYPLTGWKHVSARFDTATSGSATITVNWSQVGITTGAAAVTDLWAQKARGTISGSYSATLRPGETRLIRAVPATS